MRFEHCDKFGLPLFIILIVTVTLYFPALDSLFILDDSPNLRDLVLIPENGIFYYLLGNTAGPTGRPLSILSFALQHASWPDDAFAFKLVNLLIHLVNGILVYLLANTLARLLQLSNKERLALTILVTAVWLLHPLHVNAVLYTVQRMTLLATLFSLFAIMLALKLLDTAGRQAGSISQLRFLTVIYGLMCLAILSKEIGILVPLYLLSVVFTVGQDGFNRIVNRRVVLALLLLPVMAMLVYLLFFKNIQGIYAIRTYSLNERLITECNVLIDYLTQVVIPGIHGFSLFHDDYPVARGLLSPPGTLFSLLLIVVLVVAGFFCRGRFPVFSLAVFWFFSGHLLESTVIGLELYYEHRNYLPSFGILFFIAYCIVMLGRHVQRKYLVVAALAWSGATGLTTAGELELWKNPYLQARVWSMEHPDSRRALDHFWNMSLVYKKHNDLEPIYRQFRDRHPQDIYPMIKQAVLASCYDEVRFHSDETFWAEARELATRNGYRDLSLISLYEDLMHRLSQGQCHTQYLTELLSLNDRLMSNRKQAHLKERFLDVNLTLSYYLGDYDRALAYLKRFRDHNTSPDLLMTRAQILLAADRPEEARRTLSKVRKLFNNDRRNRLYFKNRMYQLELETGQ